MTYYAFSNGTIRLVTTSNQVGKITNESVEEVIRFEIDSQLEMGCNPYKQAEFYQQDLHNWQGYLPHPTEDEMYQIQPKEQLLRWIMGTDEMQIAIQTLNTQNVIPLKVTEEELEEMNIQEILLGIIVVESDFQ